MGYHVVGHNHFFLLPTPKLQVCLFGSRKPKKQLVNQVFFNNSKILNYSIFKSFSKYLAVSYGDVHLIRLCQLINLGVQTNFGSPPPTFHVSCVTCHVSSVKCHLSSVKCHFLLLIFVGIVVKLVGGGSDVNGATPSRFSLRFFICMVIVVIIVVFSLQPLSPFTHQMG